MGPDPLQVLGVTVDGKYELTEFVERRDGRYIYRANHRYWSEPVAIGFFSHDATVVPVDVETAQRTYLRVGSQLARLSTRNSAFVQNRDCGLLRSQVGEFAYLVTEWIDGASLTEVLARNRTVGSTRLGLGAIMEWFQEILRALTLAHEAGIVHGALDSSRLFVVGGTFRPSVPIKLRGLTEAALRASSPALAGRSPEGDPRYLAPEVIERPFDPARLGAWTDVYGLARVMVELLTGSPPPQGSAVGMAEAHVSRQSLYALDRALADDPDERFKTIESFRTAVLEGMGIRGGRSPRRTMVVADQLRADASAGVFEVGADAAAGTIAPAPVADVDAPQPRVRLAFTHRHDAAERGTTPKPVPASRRTLAVPPAMTPTPLRPHSSHTPTPSPSRGSSRYGSGIYDQLAHDRTRAIVLVAAILAFGALFTYLIILMNSR